MASVSRNPIGLNKRVHQNSRILPARAGVRTALGGQQVRRVNHGHAVEHKLIDAASSVAATLNNIGPGLGVIGATKNYSNFTPATKILFIGLMMIGRLEIFVILVLFVPAFWRSQ